MANDAMGYSDMSSPSTAQEGDEKPMDGEQEEEHETSALLPKSILAGKEFKVGEEVVLKIVSMHDDEIEVEYSEGKPDKSESMTEMDKSKSSMDRYATEPSQT